MDGAQAKVDKKVTINEEKDKIIERFEMALSVLKEVEINEEDLVHVKKPLNELESYLKYIPNGPFFNDVLPTEIQERILKLSFPRDTDAFIAASVCQQWKRVLKIEGQKKVVYCENGERVNPAELMKAVATLKLDVHLVIREPVTEVEPKLVTDALARVSKFTINNYKRGGTLSDEQFEHLFVNIEKGDKIMEEVELFNLDLKGINQERLANCLVNKIKRLKLEASVGFPIGGGLLGVGTFMSKLLQDSQNQKLSHLTLICPNLSNYFHDGENTFISALCKVENVKLGWQLFMPDIISLMRNIIETPIVMKTLILNLININDFRKNISPQDLKTVFIKMKTARMEGAFTVDQLDAVRSLPDVQIGFIGHFHRVALHTINKGSTEWH